MNEINETALNYSGYKEMAFDRVVFRRRGRFPFPALGRIPSVAPVAPRRDCSSRNRRLRSNLLSVAGLKLLHQKMFNEVWKWAGSFRVTEKNVGVLAYQVTPQLHNLCEDVKTQLAHQSYPLDECAVRFHHRLTLIHPFPNGNGRHARLACDLLLRFNGAEEFTWGRANLTGASAVRKAYIDALRHADGGDISLLRQFARS